MSSNNPKSPIILFHILLFAYYSRQQTPLSAVKTKPLNIQFGQFSLTSADIKDPAITVTMTYGGIPTMVSCDGVVGMTGSSFFPTTEYSMVCNNSIVNTVQTTFTCYAKGVSILSLTYHYFVFDLATYRSQQNSAFSSIIRSEIPIEQANLKLSIKRQVTFTINRGSNFILNRLYKCFVFITGFQFKTTTDEISLNQTCLTRNGDTMLTFSISQDLSIQRLYVSLLHIDMQEMTLSQNIKVSAVTGSYILDELTNEQAISYDVLNSNFSYFFGLKSFTFKTDSFLNNFLAQPSPIDSTFAVGYNGIQYLFLRKLSCSNPTHKVEMINEVCFTSRNGCTNDELLFYADSEIIGTQLQKEYKMFAYSTKSIIYVVRYNGVDFSEYARIINPDLASDIRKFEFSSDFSRVAFITFASGFYIYAWNGTEYNPEHHITKSIFNTTQFYNFDISSDFKRAIVPYKCSDSTDPTSPTSTLIDLLVFDASTQTYSVSTHSKIIYPEHIFISDNSSQAYFFHSATFQIWNLSHPTLDNIKPPLPIQESVVANSLSDVSISGNKHVIAIQYSRIDVNLYNRFYGIKILQYNPLTKAIEFHHRIQPKLYDFFTHEVHILELSWDGLKLILQPTKTSIGYRVIFTRASLSDHFELSELIKDRQISKFESSNYALSVSDNFEFILSGAPNNTIALFFCNGIIHRPYFLFTINKAKPIQISIVPQTDVVEDVVIDNSAEVEKMKINLSSAKQLQIAAIIVAIILLCLLIFLIVYVIWRAWMKKKEAVQTNTMILSRDNIVNDQNSKTEADEVEEKNKNRKRNVRRQKVADQLMKTNVSQINMNESFNNVEVTVVDE